LTEGSTPVIAIDGPSGSGKGTIAQLVAQALEFHLLDSGALYRLTAVAALNRGVLLTDEAPVAELAAGLQVRFEPVPGEGVRTLLDDKDVTRALRTEQCAMAASKVAAMKSVRLALLERQRAFRRPPGLVADGRDMGTVVFPGAELKLFLTASAEERARRRYKQLKEKGLDVTLLTLLEDIKARDQQDSNRPVSPLRPAADAIILDSTAMAIDAVQDRVLELAKHRLTQKLF
jgi:cytidylate kinase